MFVEILLTIVIIAFLIFLIYKDYKKKRTRQYRQQKHSPDKKLEKQIAIEKEKSRRGFVQNGHGGNGGF